MIIQKFVLAYFLNEPLKERKMTRSKRDPKKDAALIDSLGGSTKVTHLLGMYGKNFLNRVCMWKKNGIPNHYSKLVERLARQDEAGALSLSMSLKLANFEFAIGAYNLGCELPNYVIEAFWWTSIL
jgi:hypothetical protein